KHLFRQNAQNSQTGLKEHLEQSSQIQDFYTFFHLFVKISRTKPLASARVFPKRIHEPQFNLNGLDLWLIGRIKKKRAPTPLGGGSFQRLGSAGYTPVRGL